MDIVNEIKSLNKEQKEAVSEKKHKRLLVLAGAGSGKTRVLTVRIAYLLLQMNVNPRDIFAVTFTNKAANEMKERIKSLTGTKIDISKMWIGTFHSLARRILKENFTATNLPESFNILDDSDKKSLIKRAISDLKLEEDEILPPSAKIKEIVDTASSFITKCKESALRPEKSKPMLKEVGLPAYYLDIYKFYEKIRITSKSVDFTDLILYAVEILRDNSEIRKYYQNSFRHILVDEFQDTNPLQYLFINLLTNERTYHTVVGDDDQLIYGWRGANLDNMQKYKEENKKDLKIVKLEQNYRSTSNILNAANVIIANNEKRLGKTLWSEKDAGDKISIIEGHNQDEEAVIVINEIKKLLKQGVNKNEIAILYRNNFLSRPLESQLTKNNITYQVIGGLAFWLRKEIKDIMSYLLLVQNNDNDVAFERVINFPKRGLGKKTIEKIKINANEKSISLFKSLEELLLDKSFSKKNESSFKDFIKIIKDGESLKNNINRLVNFIVLETEIEEEYKKDLNTLHEKLKNIEELINYSGFFEKSSQDKDVLSDFLQSSQLQTDAQQKEKTNAITLMTIHASKGLEFPYVFLVGAENGIFPSHNSIDLQQKMPELIEEERRLAYVAITRAQVKMSISFSRNRYYNITYPSMFLSELPIELLNHVSKDLYGISEIGQRIRDYKKENSKNSSDPYKIDDVFEDEIMGEGIIVNIEENEKYYILYVDFDFCGISKKYIEK
tara:strand:+ start:56652 stop:58832 length:2181 start_codon:yes stop_codon:yes gene_type:complete